MKNGERILFRLEGLVKLDSGWFLKKFCITKEEGGRIEGKVQIADCTNAEIESEKGWQAEISLTGSRVICIDPERSDWPKESFQICFTANETVNKALVKFILDAIGIYSDYGELNIVVR